MPRYVGTVVIPKPIKEVFDYMAQFENVSEWDPSIVRAERLDAGPTGPGARFRIVVRFLGRESSLDYETADYEPPRTLVMRAETNNVASLDTISLAPGNGGGTVLTYDADLRLKGLARVAALPIALAFRANNERAKARLERVLAA